jgi:hypothetical protein
LYAVFPLVVKVECRLGSLALVGFPKSKRSNLIINTGESRKKSYTRPIHRKRLLFDSEKEPITLDLTIVPPSKSRSIIIILSLSTIYLSMVKIYVDIDRYRNDKRKNGAPSLRHSQYPFFPWKDLS